MTDPLEIKPVLHSALILIGLALVATGLPLAASAAPTQEETDAFFAQQRKEKADFNRSIVAETDSRTAATLDFNEKERAERLAFANALPARPTAEQLQLSDDFNAALRQKRKDFEASLAALPKSKLEQTIVDFDARAIRDRNALDAQLAGTDPETHSEAVRQFQNLLLQQRAKIKNDALNDIATRQRQFRQDQARKAQDFFGS